MRTTRILVFASSNEKIVIWTRAYKAAAQYVLLSIGFSIIGDFIFYLGIVTIAPSDFGAGGSYQMGFGIIEIIFGLIIMLLGNLASFFKVNSKIIGDEIGERCQATEDNEKPTIRA